MLRSLVLVIAPSASKSGRDEQRRKSFLRSHPHPFPSPSCSVGRYSCRRDGCSVRWCENWDIGRKREVFLLLPLLLLLLLLLHFLLLASPCRWRLMSALVLGKRSFCFFEELDQSISAGAGATATSPPPSASKRARLGASPTRLSPSRTPAASAAPTASGASSHLTGLDHLRSLFPDMDDQLLVKTFEACSNDVDSAIRKLNELRWGAAERSLHFVVNDYVEDINTIAQPAAEGNSDGSNAASETTVVNNVSVNRSEWMDLCVREMINATDVNDARSRASVVLEVFEKAIMARASSGAAQAFHKENMLLKEHIESLLRDNNILKRAVAIQHERQKDFDEKDRQLQHQKQQLAQYQEHIRALEIKNYALSMHLKQAQQSSSIPGRFHPDVF